MTLPKATLFPQSLLPLYIFEPRYRRMLEDTLQSHRMFIVAMQRPGCQRELPSPVAGLGFIRVSVDHEDGTSHLILQGLTRVELTRAVRYKPYRVERIRPLATPPCDSVAVDALMEKARELVAERIHLGLASGHSLPATTGSSPSAPGQPVGKDILKYLGSLERPDQLADLVACAILQDSDARQAILATAQVDERLRRLIQFLLAEIRQQRKGESHE